LLGALGDTEAPDPTTQDMGSASLLFPESADFTLNSFVIGPLVLPIVIDGNLVTLENVVLSGSFSPDYEYLGNGELEGDLDLRSTLLAVGMDPEDIILGLCDTLGVCSDCQSDPGRVECIHLRIEDIRGDLRTDSGGLPIPVIPVAAVTVFAAETGVATDRILELELTHPETGAVQPNVEITLSVMDGDGFFPDNGDLQSITVTTDANGQAFVLLRDLTTVIDDLDVDINPATTPDPYDCATSSIKVSFN
jgi:hypothetical protein